MNQIGIPGLGNRGDGMSSGVANFIVQGVSSDADSSSAILRG